MSGSLRDKLMAAADASESKRQQPYDGVCGVLPFASWPVNFHRDFEGTRDKLLRDGYTAEQLQTYIADVIETTKAALNNPANPPNCNPACPFDIYSDVEILAHYWMAVQRGESEGLAFLTDTDHAGRVKKGDDYHDHQADIASNPRGKIGDNGATNDQIIGQLALANEYLELGAKELWQHYISALNDLALNAKEDETNPDWKKWTILYDFNGSRKPITGGQFANVVSDYRTGKRSG